MHKEVILFIVVSPPPTLLFHNRSKSQVADLPEWAGHSNTIRNAPYVSCGERSITRQIGTGKSALIGFPCIERNRIQRFYVSLPLTSTPRSSVSHLRSAIYLPISVSLL